MFMLLREHLHSSLYGKTLFSKSLFGKAALATAALGGFFLLAGAPAAQAANHDDCRRRIAHAEHELGEAIEDHGYDSRQANHWRHERREAYERCYGREYYRDRDGYYRDERGNYYRYDNDRDRYYRDNDRDRRRRDWDDD
jgi:hypothetical protein